MLSGLGPSETLQRHAIPVVANLPGVGRHLLDHPGVLLKFRVHERDSIRFMTGTSLVDRARRIYAVLQFLLFGTGPLTCSVE